MIKKNQVKSVNSRNIVENIVIKPNSGITGNIVGQAMFTEDPDNSDMDRLKYEYRRRR